MLYSRLRRHTLLVATLTLAGLGSVSSATHAMPAPSDLPWHANPRPSVLPADADLAAVAEEPDAILDEILRVEGAIGDFRAQGRVSRPPLDQIGALQMLPRTEQYAVVYFEAEAPLAAVGDAFFVLGDAGQVRPARVASRARVKEMEWVDSEDYSALSVGTWAYLVESTDDVRRLALPVPMKPLPRASASGAVRTSFRPVFRAELDRAFAKRVAELREWERQGVPVADPAHVRQALYAASGHGSYEEVEFVHFPAQDGVRYWVSLQLNDHPDSECPGSAYTFILDARGTVLEKMSGERVVLALVDVNDDGIAEIMTEGGLAHWNGREWLYPEADVFYGGC
jgi:hypothetical protein